MILVDTSVWINHFRKADPKLQGLLHDNEVLLHPLVLMELALGSIGNRRQMIASLALLPQARVAELDELFVLIERRELYRKGIGVTDLHLLASALFESCSLWTLDKKLSAAAALAGVDILTP